MICERVKEQIADYLSGALEDGARGRLLSHLDTCAPCRDEVAELDSVWRKLDLLPLAEPTARLRSRFDEMLSAYQSGMDATFAAKQQKPRLSWFFVPTWAAAACSVLLMIGGVAIGRSARPQLRSQEGGELESLRQLVTLSLLQQQSPGSRLRGVNYSYKMERPDPQVESALLYAVSHDTNVNVRLSALDALQKFAGTPAVGRALIDAIQTQDSPLVQIGLIDLLVGRNETDVLPALRKLTQDSNVNPAVRQRAQWGINQLGAA